MSGTNPLGSPTTVGTPPFVAEKTPIFAAPAEIVQLKPAPAKPGWKTSEGQLTAITNVVGIVTAVTDILPAAYRWVGLALMGIANVAYTVSRGIAKR